MSRCGNCGFDLDKKDEDEEDEPATGAGSLANAKAPVVAAGEASVDAEGSPEASSVSPPDRVAGEPTTLKKPRIAWDAAFRSIRKGKLV